MARNNVVQERIKALVAELLAEETTEELRGRPENINDIEDAMVRIGDMVAREFGTQKLAEHLGETAARSQCPDCGHEGVFVGDRSRDLITRRGPVPLTEAKYRCPKCRRHFFPSDVCARD
jgi:predicted RNA-binding Zn-ribbon protein involved in translation (DUF1610 family)